MHTVELLPSASLSDRVRDLWARLAAAGLPSLATHTHATNRPHLTVVTAPTLTGLPPLPLPLPVSLGKIHILGRALVWAVDPTPGLSTLHESVWSALGGWPPPAEFVPHISLALRVPPDAQPTALALLAETAPLAGHVDAARTYDTETRTVRDL